MFLTSIMLAHGAGKWPIALFTDLELAAYDLRLTHTMPGGVDPRVIIIDIDEKSLQRVGQFPWPRNVVAELTDKLFADYGVETMGFDMVFSEPDIDHSLAELRQRFTDQHNTNQALKEFLAQPTRDQRFAEVLQEYNTVIGMIFDNDNNSDSVGELPTALFSHNQDIINYTNPPVASRFAGNIAEIHQATYSGYMTLIDNIDHDGKIREVSLFNRYEDKLYPALALVVAQQYLGTEISEVIVESTTDYLALEKIDLGFETTPVNGHGAVLVPYRGYQGSFPYISAVDVLEDNIANPDDLFGTIALLGTSATGLADLRPTPMQGVFPGVEIQANLIASLLDGNFKEKPEWARAVDVISILVIGLLLSFCLPRISALYMTLLGATISALVIGWNFYAWQHLNLVLPIASLSILCCALYLLNMISGFFSETHQRRALGRSFGRYVPAEIVGEMQGKTVEELLRSEKRDMSVLFSDIRDFTSVSEQLDPETLSTVINAFLTPMTKVIHEHRGAIDKYMGDAMMAFWGAPLTDENHANHSVSSALALIDTMDIVNQDFKKKQWPALKIGVGIASGPMSVGNMGSEFRMAYTVMGDSVNVGSRLEGLTKQYGVPIIISETTAQLASDFICLKLDKIRVKGKKEPIAIYQPLAEKGSLPEQTIAMKNATEMAINDYQSQRWQQAKEAFNLLGEQYQHPIFAIYLARLDNLTMEQRATHWDGAMNYATK